MDNLEHISNKSFFKLDEVCGLTGVRPYILRFWEAEFHQISPITSSDGAKLYEHKDIDTILTIKRLLFEEKFTIEKAKAHLKNMASSKIKAEDSRMEEEQIEVATQSPSLVSCPPLDMEKILKTKVQLQSLLDKILKIKEGHQWP